MPDLDAYLAALIEVASEATPGKDGAPDDDAWGSMQAIVDLMDGHDEKKQLAMDFFSDDPQDEDGKPLSLDGMDIDAEFALIKTGTKNKYGKPGWKNTETKKYIYQDSEPGSKKAKKPEEPTGAKKAATEKPLVSSGKAAPEPKAPPATATEQPLTGPPKAPPAQPGAKPPAQPTSPPKPQAPKLAPDAQKRLGELQSAQQKETSDPSHPINRLRSQLADARFSPDGPAIKTLRSTQDKPLTAQDHAAMSRMHARLGGILGIVGNKELSEANFAAARYHKGAAEAKQKATTKGTAKPPDYVGKSLTPLFQEQDQRMMKDDWRGLVPEHVKYPDNGHAIDRLDAKQLKSVEAYTVNSYEEINAAMRRCPPNFECLDSRQRKEVENIESAIASAGNFAEPVTVFRGITLTPEVADKIWAEVKQAHESGQDYQLPSITSTSFRLGTATNMANRTFSMPTKGIVYHIKAKSGLYTAPRSALPQEAEVLKSANTKYRIAGLAENIDVGKDWQDQAINRNVIYLEEI